MGAPSPGRFITFEGTEGGGKSTQIQILAERLKSEGRVARCVREPGGTALGEEVRSILKHGFHGHPMTAESELMLMNACRAQLVREVIRPAIAAGEIVLCDRFADSTVAYQGFGREMGWERVRPVIDLAVGATWPHRTILLSVPVEVSEARRASRGSDASGRRDRFEEEDRAFFHRVEAGFRAVADADPHRVRVINATREVEAVAVEVWSHVRDLF
ncbi:MAG: dTMP kinase [Verrucomicrobia bacterium]|nr:dTMP kinase [Verrucomicrobiota bacterium]MBI3868985.1 dTMP kinase [Verrucomicrobiota bacterium]